MALSRVALQAHKFKGSLDTAISSSSSAWTLPGGKAPSPIWLIQSRHLLLSCRTRAAKGRGAGEGRGHTCGVHLNDLTVSQGVRNRADGTLRHSEIPLWSRRDHPSTRLKGAKQTSQRQICTNCPGQEDIHKLLWCPVRAAPRGTQILRPMDTSPGVSGVQPGIDSRPSS